MSRDLAPGGRIFAKFVSKDARYFNKKSHRKLPRDQRRLRDSGKFCTGGGQFDPPPVEIGLRCRNMNLAERGSEQTRNIRNEMS